MTDTDFEQLEREERETWNELEREKERLKPLEQRWHELYTKLQKARVRREVEAEMKQP